VQSCKVIGVIKDMTIHSKIKEGDIFFESDKVIILDNSKNKILFNYSLQAYKSMERYRF
jgi:hypothetical protein